VYVEGGTVTISSSQIESNTAHGGNGGAIYNSSLKIVSGSAGGGAAGGGIYAGSGTVHLTYDDVQGNEAYGGYGTSGRGPEATNASGGGLYVVTGSTVTKDAFTLGYLINNADSNNDSNDNFGTGGPV
jgi:hypothetical protein